MASCRVAPCDASSHRLDVETKLFRSSDAVRFGWARTRENLGPLVALAAVGGFLNLIQQGLGSNEHRMALAGLLVLGLQALQVGVTLAFIRTALEVHDGEHARLNDLGRLLKDYLPFLLTIVLYALVVAAGFILLVVPGFIWGLQFGFAPFLVVDRKLDPLEAMKESSRITRGHKWQLLGFALMLFGINLLGAIALGIGLLLTIPLSWLAIAFVYRKLERATVRVEPVGQITALGEPLISR